MLPISAQESCHELLAGFHIEGRHMVFVALERNSLLRICFLSLYREKSIRWNTEKKLLLGPSAIECNSDFWAYFI